MRNAGMTSDEAREAAIDVYNRGGMITPQGTMTRRDIFTQGRQMVGPQAAPSSIPPATQPPVPPRERFRERGTVASTAGINPENLRNMAKVESFKPTSKPQIMPATASDAASGRVDTMGPEGSPSQITSKYGTASITPGPRVGKAMTRDTFAGRNVPLKEWLRQRRAAQAERGIA